MSASVKAAYRTLASICVVLLLSGLASAKFKDGEVCRLYLKNETGGPVEFWVNRIKLGGAYFAWESFKVNPGEPALEVSTRMFHLSARANPVGDPLNYWLPTSTVSLEADPSETGAWRAGLVDFKRLNSHDYEFVVQGRPPRTKTAEERPYSERELQTLRDMGFPIRGRARP